MSCRPPALIAPRKTLMSDLLDFYSGLLAHGGLTSGYPYRLMIAVNNLGKHYGAQNLFSDASFQLLPGHCYGLVGANGSGKSTFLRILTGEEGASDGEVNMPKSARLGVLEQDHFLYEEMPILQVAMMGSSEVWQAMEEKEKLLERADVEFDADRYAKLEDLIMRHDGYTLEARAGEVLEGLGIPTKVHPEPLSTLSGGFKLRVLLAKVLSSSPDVLFLDEPTNHLDILSIRWLEKFLNEYRGCTVAISHDHRFLDNVATQTLDVDYETILLYPGNYSYFVTAKAEERARREAEIAKREKEIADQKAFVERFRAKATKARQAQSRVKRIEKIVIDRLPQSSRRYPHFSFKARRPSGKVVLTLEGITKSYDDNLVLNNVDLEVRRNDRLAIIGPNGIGKSTLLKIVMGEVAVDQGEFEWGYEAQPGYFAQDHQETLGESKATVESWLWDCCPAEPIGFVRGQLARVLFSKDEVEKKITALSGGEAARLILASLTIKQPNLLILDEPTNHLDLESIEALVEALESYEGTLIFVSHDRWFVSRLATRILEITPEGINDYDGSYEEYLAACGDDHLDAQAVTLKAKQEKKKNRKQKVSRGDRQGKELLREKKSLEKEREGLTTSIEKAEARVGDINDLFCNPGFFDKTSPKEVKRLESEQEKLKSTVEEALARWEVVEEEIAELEEQLAD